MLHTVLHGMTNFGDGAVVAALVALLAAFLVAAKQKKAALAVVLACVLVAGGIALSKVLLYSRCGQEALWLGLRSPSGHSAMSLVGYGLLAVCVASSLTGWRRWGLLFLAAGWVAGIAASRVLLHYHTLGDVIAGLILGAVAVGVVGRFVMTGEKIRCRWGLFAAIALLILAGLYGRRLPAEDLITMVANYVRSYARAC